MLSPRLLALFLVTQARSPLVAADIFTELFPQYNNGFQAILHSNCSIEYSLYKANNSDVNSISPLMHLFHEPDLIDAVVNCILTNTPEVIKSKMAAAQVLMGLAPTILATMGPSSQEIALLAVVGRKSLLSLFLAAGSPAVFPLRAIEYVRPIEELKRPRGRDLASSYFRNMVVVALEYLVAAAAIANVAQLSIGIRHYAIFSILPGTHWLVFLWAFLGFTIHVMGTIALSLRVAVKDAQQEETDHGRGRRHRTRLVSKVLVHAWMQFQPSSIQTPIIVQLFPESLTFLVFTWFAAVLTACYLIFGTLMFSSILFISVRDSVWIVLRLLASVTFCRVILMYELSVLRRSFEIQGGSIVDLADAPAAEEDEKLGN